MADNILSTHRRSQATRRESPGPAQSPAPSRWTRPHASPSSSLPSALVDSHAATVRRPPAPPEVGDVLGGRWRLQKLLGQGGFGSVYQAVHVLTGQPAAIKILNAKDAANPPAVKLFLREGRLDNEVDTAAQVPLPRGPGSVRVFDASPGEAGGEPPYLAMELLQGEPLNKLLHRAGGKISSSDAVPIANQVLRSVDVANRRGVVHRDLKPDNLFVTPQGDVRLLDFGLAQVRGTKGAEYSGPGLGTIGFAAPEQVAGERVDGRADVWGVGATLYKMLTGETPTPRTNLAVKDPYSACPVPPVRSKAPNVPIEVARVVDRALECDKSKRWRTAGEMQRALRKAVFLKSKIDEELSRR